MRCKSLATITVAALLVSMSHAESFFDDFEDNNLFDGHPVTWTAVEGSIRAVGGSMELTPALPGMASAYVRDFDHENVLIEMTFEYTSADNQFVTPLFRDRINGLGDVYYAGIFSDGELAIGYFEPPGNSTVQAQNVFLPTGRIAAGDDVTLLVKIVGGAITLEAWETAEGRGQSATLSWTDPLNRYPTGTDIGLGFNPFGNPAPILVHSFGVTMVPDCDFDMDGNCSIEDLNALLSEGPVADGVAVTPGTNDRFDLTGNGVIDNADVDEWLALAADEIGFGSPYKRGDANLDGTVDGLDFIDWNESKFTATLLWDTGDFNGDGVNDGQDFIVWNENKFTSSDGVVAVPEPTATLLSLTVLILGMRIRRVLQLQ